MSKTPMQILKEKLIEKAEGLSIATDYKTGLLAAVNLIDSEMIDLEQSTIVKAHDTGVVDGQYDTGFKGADYYNNEYK